MSCCFDLRFHHERFSPSPYGTSAFQEFREAPSSDLYHCAGIRIITFVPLPWEASMVREIEKAILMSDVGINPTNDGKTIRLVFPDLNEERRKELAKDIKKLGENAKVAVRNIRRDANDTLKKAGKEEDLSEDEIKNLETEVQKMTDSYIAKIDGAIDNKTKEIMTV
jgi:ribosome recycling factor